MPKGIRVTYNGVVYNKWTSSAFGDVSPNSNSTPVYLGNSSSGTPPTIGNYPIFEANSLYQYEEVPNQTENVQVGTGQIKTTATQPLTCTLVVPKMSASINYLDVKIYNLLTSTDYLSSNFVVSCVTSLVSTDADVTQTYGSSSAACGGATDNGGQVFSISTPSGGWSIGTRVYANANGTSPAVNIDATSPGYGDRLFGSAGWVLTGVNDPTTGGEQAIELNDESCITATFGCAP